MAETVSINMQITDTQTDKSSSKAISDINPNASASAINDFATELMGLTTHSINSIDRISKMPLNEFVTPRQTPTFTLGTPSWSNQGSRHATIPYTYDGDGRICASAYRTDTTAAVLTDIEVNNNTITIYNDDGWKTATVYICTSETDTYKSILQTTSVTDPNQ